MLTLLYYTWNPIFLNKLFYKVYIFLPYNMIYLYNKVLLQRKYKLKLRNIITPLFCTKRTLTPYYPKVNGQGSFSRNYKLS